MSYYNNIPKAIATLPSATRAFVACSAAAEPSPVAPLAFPVVVGAREVLEEVLEVLLELEVVLVGRIDVGGGRTGVTDAEGTGAPEGAAGGAAPLPPPPTGAGFASAGLVRAPVPQGIGSLLPGCSLSVGGELAPEASAIVNRVVQVLLVGAGEENW